MKSAERSKATLLISLSALAFAFSASASPKMTPPLPEAPKAYLVKDPIKFKMTRGPTVHFAKRDGVPLVDVAMHIGAGGRDDPDALPGLAAWTANLVTQGTGRYDALAFSDAIDSLGASLSVSAGWDSTEVHLHVPSARLKEALALTVRALRRPHFSAIEWARLRKKLESSYLQEESSAHAIATRARARALYKDTRYERMLNGDTASLKAAKIGDIGQFHKRLYRPDNIDIAVSGDIDIESLSIAFRDAFKNWWPPRAPLNRQAPTRIKNDEGARIILVDKPGAAQTVLYATSHIEGKLDLLDADGDVLNALLGGSFTSRLNQNLREKNQFSYGARSAFNKSARTQTFLARTDVATPVSAPALKELNKELNNIRTYIEDSEALRARKYRALTFVERFATGSRVASYWAWAIERDITGAQIRSYAQSLLNVNERDMLRFARQAVSTKGMQYIVVGDLKVIEKDIRALKIAPVVVWDKALLFKANEEVTP